MTVCDQPQFDTPRPPLASGEVSMATDAGCLEMLLFGISRFTHRLRDGRHGPSERSRIIGLVSEDLLRTSERPLDAALGQLNQP